MDKSVLVLVCALAVGIVLQVCNGREIIVNEDTLVGTCKGTCYDIPDLHSRDGCKSITSCQLSSGGWIRFFTKCDYCICNCEEDSANQDIMVERHLISITEPDLLDTCDNTCDNSGLVRTNFRDCHEVRDCYTATYGWTSGFVRCDYCTCNCINRKRASEYAIRNIQYDLSQIDEEGGAPKALAETILENTGNAEQKASRMLTFTTTRTTSVVTTTSLQIGLTVTVGATAEYPGVGSVSTEISTSLNSGFSYMAGSSWQESQKDSVKAEVKVPPHSSVRVIVSGKTIMIDIPFEADQVTTYEDGSTSIKRINGTYRGVETTRFTVKYEPAKLIEGNVQNMARSGQAEKYLLVGLVSLIFLVL